MSTVLCRDDGVLGSEMPQPRVSTAQDLPPSLKADMQVSPYPLSRPASKPVATVKPIMTVLCILCGERYERCGRAHILSRIRFEHSDNEDSDEEEDSSDDESIDSACPSNTPDTPIETDTCESANKSEGRNSPLEEVKCPVEEVICSPYLPGSKPVAVVKPIVICASGECSETDLYETGINDENDRIDEVDEATEQQDRTEQNSGKRSADSGDDVQAKRAKLDYDAGNDGDDEASYSCFFCEEEFSGTADLRQHMLTHNGPGPFVCYFCKRNFRIKSHLSLHMSRHRTEKLF